jgi:hypothetical protein
LSTKEGKDLSHVMKQIDVDAQNETAELGGQKYTLKLNLNWSMST